MSFQFYHHHLRIHSLSLPSTKLGERLYFQTIQPSEYRIWDTVWKKDMLILQADPWVLQVYSPTLTPYTTSSARILATCLFWSHFLPALTRRQLPLAAHFNSNGVNIQKESFISTINQEFKFPKKHLQVDYAPFYPSLIFSSLNYKVFCSSHSLHLYLS